MGKVRVLDYYGARQIPNPTGPPMGERIIGTAVKDLGEMLAEEFSSLPKSEGRIFSDYWRTMRGSPFMLLAGANANIMGAVHYADIRFKRHWYIPSKIMLTVLGREWEDLVFIDARCPGLLSIIKRAADKFVTRSGMPDVHIYAIGPEFSFPQPPPVLGRLAPNFSNQ